MSDKNAMAGLYKVMQILVEELDKDLPLSYALAFLRIAMAGDLGVDNKRLQDDLKASSGGMSRMVQTLGAIHWQKDKAGFGLINRDMGAADNRMRQLSLTPKGEKLVAKLVAQLNKL